MRESSIKQIRCQGSSSSGKGVVPSCAKAKISYAFKASRPLQDQGRKMFSCPDCGKKYLSQNSLRRHLNNHSVQTRGHRCPTCKLAFSRRDLMVRHLAIHDNGPCPVRRRCHTACEPCRIAHEKCNGKNPCNICWDREQHCTYRQRNRRVSQPPINGNTATIEIEKRPVTRTSENPRVNYSVEVERAPSPDFLEPALAALNTQLERNIPETASSCEASEVHDQSTKPSSSVDRTNQQQKSNTTNAIQSESYSGGFKSTTLQSCLDITLQDLPETPEEDDILLRNNHKALNTELEWNFPETVSWWKADNVLDQPIRPSFLVDGINQQQESNTGVVQSENYSGGMNSTILDCLDIVLPDLPVAPTEENIIRQNNYEPQNADLERNVSEVASWWEAGAGNLLHQPTRPDSFPALFDSLDFTPQWSLPKSPNLQGEDRSNFREARPPLPFLSDMNHQSQGLPTFPDCRDRNDSSNNASSGGLRREWCSEQKALVKDLVDYAITASDIPSDERRCYWELMSGKVCTVFGLGQTHDSEDCILIQMVHLYKRHLLPLWPMICEKDLEEPASLNPVLFLVAVSVGAMYLDNKAGVLGRLMHERIRTSLVTSFIELEVTEPDLIWLAQARNTIQVVGLYFSQGLELSYAQHLGALLLSQSRRMSLFKHIGAEELPAGSPTEDRVAAWVRAETRRRVAFGIFRADVFLSLLLNCPPNISSEELEIPLPYPDSLWKSIGKLPPEELMAAVEQERLKRNETLFCDLVRIILDRDEALLPMDARGYELLLFGLQGQVWKFSHDPDMFQRLVGRPWQEEGHAESLDMEISRVFNNPGMNWAPRDHLQMSHRDMNDLVLDRRRLSKALAKWSQSFNARRPYPGFNNDRAGILSSLLLFHIYHLQLNASLDVLHHVAERLYTKTAIDTNRLSMAIRWAHNAQARHAAHHALKIWSLLDNEARVNPMKQARYNMLSYMGLYHASVVLWAYLGARRADEQLFFAASGSDHLHGDRGAQSSEVLISIVLLYQRLKSMSWDTFATSVQRLSSYQFPGNHS